MPEANSSGFEPKSRIQLYESGALSTISFFPERVVFGTSESELRSGEKRNKKTKRIPGWRQSPGIGIFKTVSGDSLAGSGLRTTALGCLYKEVLVTGSELLSRFIPGNISFLTEAFTGTLSMPRGASWPRLGAELSFGQTDLPQFGPESILLTPSPPHRGVEALPPSGSLGISFWA